LKLDAQELHLEFCRARAGAWIETLAFGNLQFEKCRAPRGRVMKRCERHGYCCAGVAPRAARGLKHNGPRTLEDLLSRPARARGLKLLVRGKSSMFAVAPRAGRGIETNRFYRWAAARRRARAGAWIETSIVARGLGKRRSRPARGRWIEKTLGWHFVERQRRAPAGAWIEPKKLEGNIKSQSRPARARGLNRQLRQLDTPPESRPARAVIETSVGLLVAILRRAPRGRVD
jgi:hypothetical protein